MMLQLHSNEKCFKESYFISKIKYTPCIKGPPVPTWTPKPHMMLSQFCKAPRTVSLTQTHRVHVDNPFITCSALGNLGIIGKHAGEQMGPWCWGCVLIYCPGVFLITHLIGTATPLWNNNVQLIITNLGLLIAYSYQLTSRNQAGNRKCHRESRFAWGDWDNLMSTVPPVLVWWGKGYSF